MSAAFLAGNEQVISGQIDAFQKGTGAENRMDFIVLVQFFYAQPDGCGEVSHMVCNTCPDNPCQVIFLMDGFFYFFGQFIEFWIVQWIKLIRIFSYRSLKDARDCAEHLPAIIDDHCPDKDAFVIKKEFEDAGAAVQLERVWS